MTTPFNFAEYEAICAGKSTAELLGALRDIRATLPTADANDRANGTGDQGGKYRDQASCIHKELANRRK